MASVLKPSNIESMMTRNKSAQKKEVNNQTAQTLNQLLMRPNITIKKTLILENYKTHASTTQKVQRTELPEAKITIKNVINSKRKPIKKVEPVRSLLISENISYGPGKHKKKAPAKKIVLKQRHEYKVVATTNKRKRGIPHRELKPPSPKLHMSEPELSMEDLIKMADEQGMDDEDFMEILTCPSPVWWEEESEDEEEIRNKLHEGPDREDIVEEYQNDTPKIIEELHENYNVNAKHENGPTHDNLKGKSLKSDINFFKKFVIKRSKLESVLGNIKFKKTKHEISNICSITNESSSEVKKDIEVKVTNAKINKEGPSNNLKSNLSYVIANENDETIQLNDTNEADIEIVPTVLPPLTKNPFRSVSTKPAFESPKSIDSTVSETTNSSALELDSISDTNIKFLDEYFEDKNETDTKDINFRTIKSKEGELVTVYKIIGNQNDNLDVEDEIKSPNRSTPAVNKDNSKINSFYKTRKRTFTNKTNYKKKM